MNCRNDAFSWNTHFAMVSEPSADSPVKGSVWFALWSSDCVVEWMQPRLRWLPLRLYWKSSMRMGRFWG